MFIEEDARCEIDGLGGLAEGVPSRDRIDANGPLVRRGVTGSEGGAKEDARVTDGDDGRDAEFAVGDTSDHPNRDVNVAASEISPSWFGISWLPLSATCPPSLSSSTDKL